MYQQQFDKIEKVIVASGLKYAPLIEELVDHTSERVEELMNNGSSFQHSLKIALSESQKLHFQKADRNVRRSLNYKIMIKNYLKLGIRSLIKYPLVSFSNLIGLSIGLALFIGSIIYLDYERSFDSFHSKSENIYRIVTDLRTQNGDIFQTAFSGAPWGPTLASELPEIYNMTRLMKYRLPVMMSLPDTDIKFYERNIVWADSTFFSLFDYSLIIGNPDEVLSRPNQVIITESTAKRYFGDSDPIGRIISYENNQLLEVSGMMKDFPTNSHIQADLVGSFATLRNFWSILDRWGTVYYYTYLELNPAAATDLIQTKINGVLRAHLGENGENYSTSLQPLSRIHTSGNRNNELTPNITINYLLLVFGIASAVLIISIINYINISTARSLKRIKEIGIVKAMGSTRWLVFLQFLFEAWIMSLLALFLAFIVLYVFGNQLLNIVDIFIIFKPSISLISLSLLLGLIVSVLCGGLTAMKMSGITIIPALKGHVQSRYSGITPRKVLVTFQFISCIGLISSTLVVSNQIDFIHSEDPGYERSNIVSIPIYSTQLVPIEHMPLLKSSYNEIAGVAGVALSSHSLAGDQRYNTSYSVNQIDTLVMGRLHIDFDFIEVFGIELVSGRSFNESQISDSSNFIINISAAKLMGFNEPNKALNSKISYMAQSRSGSYLKSGRVVGVTQDFNFRSLHHKVTPMVMDIMPSRAHFINVKINGENYQSTLMLMKDKWNEIFLHGPFEYFFMSDRFETQYKAESRLRKIIFLFSVLSFLISTVGLTGLTYFDTAIRVKEIGIRKVLGGSSFNILLIFMREYFTMLSISFVIVVPVVYYTMNQWLENYPQHIIIGPIAFLMPVLITVLLVVASTSYIVAKILSKNPVNALRVE